MSVLSGLASAGDIVCTGSKYKVVVHDRIEATVFQDGAKPQWSDLRCGDAPEGLNCYSKNVVDAGFVLDLREHHPSGIRAALGEQWIGGVRPLAVLDCTAK